MVLFYLGYFLQRNRFKKEKKERFLITTLIELRRPMLVVFTHRGDDPVRSVDERVLQVEVIELWELKHTATRTYS